VALVLILLPIGAVWFIVSNLTAPGPSSAAVEITTFNPGSFLVDSTPHFLPTPVAALPAEPDASASAAAASGANGAAAESAPVEQVKIANTGGDGAILRADPPKGPRVAVLRDGTVLHVLEHRQLADGSEWLRVQTSDGVEGWVFAPLVAPE
jgi:hypothetical protein